MSLAATGLFWSIFNGCILLAEPNQLEESNWAAHMKHDSYFPGATWERRSPKAVGMDAAKLDAALKWLEDQSGEDGIAESVLVRKGYIVWSGPNAEETHGIWSVTKGFTSAAFSILRGQGKLSLDDKVAETLPFLREKYPDVEYRHLLTMTSGYDAAGDNRWGQDSMDWSTTPFHATTPLFEPGAQFCYWDEAMAILAGAMTIIAGEPLHALLKREVTDRIGMGDWSWWAPDQLKGLPVNSGGSGVEMSALQLAKWGYLFLRNGKWEDTQVIPEEWICEATTTQVDPGMPVADTDRKSTDGTGIYGYNWWIAGLDGMGAKGIPNLPPGSFYSSGHNHNMCFVIPDWDIVFVRCGVDGNVKGGKRPAYNTFFGKLAEALNECDDGRKDE